MSFQNLFAKINTFTKHIISLTMNYNIVLSITKRYFCISKMPPSVFSPKLSIIHYQ